MFYFSCKTDIFPSHAVMACNPFDAERGSTGERWQVVANTLGSQGCLASSARETWESVENWRKVVVVVVVVVVVEAERADSMADLERERVDMEH
jgi:hypothetical protein